MAAWCARARGRALTVADISLTVEDMHAATASTNVLTGFPELVRSAGADPGQLLRAARIPRAALTDPEGRLPLDRLAQLLDAAADVTGWPDFGLRLAKARRLSHFGQIGLLARDEPDVRHALLVMISYMHLHSENVLLQLVEEGAEAAVTARLRVWPASGSYQVNDLLLGGLFQVMRRFLGSEWRPLRVSLAHTAPAQPRIYRTYFGCPIAYDQGNDAIFSAARDLQRPLPEADPLFLSGVQRQLDERAAFQSRSLEDRVGEIIRIMLPTGRCNMERAALRLGLQSRTLHRQLSARGVTFSSLLNAIRRELAARYVGQSGRSMAQIAQLLGFSETSAFSRWFAREFSCSASAMRAAQAGGG